MSRSTRHAIIVFGAPVGRDGRPRRPLARRLEQALREARLDPAALVLVTGGPADGRPAEAAVMRDWLVARGLAPERILCEAHARSTRENARFSAPLLARAGVARVTLVTDRFHLRRSRYLLRRALAASGLEDVRLAASAAPAENGPGRELLLRISEVCKLARDAFSSAWRRP